MATLAVVPSPAVTAAPLYVIEDHLAALIETAELVSPDQEQEFRAEFQTALTAAVEKRDRVGQFLAHLEQQINFAKFEMDRLDKRSVKTAIDSGADVPGAGLVTGRHSLRRS
jgi:hypothetical protein